LTKAEQVAAVRVIVAEIMTEFGLGFDDVRLMLTGYLPIRDLPGRSESQVSQRIIRGRRDIEAASRRSPPVRDVIDPGLRPRRN